MITFYKWAIVDARELSETFFENDAIIEALEKQKSQLAKTINDLRAEVTELCKQASLKDETIAGLQQSLIERDKIVNALQADKLQRDLYAELAEQNRITIEQIDRPITAVICKRTRKKVLTAEKDTNS